MFTAALCLMYSLYVKDCVCSANLLNIPGHYTELERVKLITQIFQTYKHTGLRQASGLNLVDGYTTVLFLCFNICSLKL